MSRHPRRWLWGACASFTMLAAVGSAACGANAGSSTVQARSAHVVLGSVRDSQAGLASSATSLLAAAVVAGTASATMAMASTSPHGTPPTVTTIAAPTTTTSAAPTVTTSAAPTATTAQTAATVAAAVVRSGANVSDDPAVGDPLSISIPAIGVNSVLVQAGVLADGTVAVPPDPSTAGWFTGGPKPGQRGPAVIMGHVDSKQSGPGVFYHLVDIPIGAVVTIQTTTAPQQFVVQSVERFPKNAFPTDKVYGPVPQAALRLITCGGSFDRSIGHYRDNVVAFLVPVAG